MNSSDRYTSEAFARMLNHPVLTAEEERVLGNRSRRGDRKAWQRLVSCNMRLVVHIAQTYHCPNGKVPFEDLVSAGLDGLCQVARKYRPEKGRFSTYASHYIRSALQKHLRRFGWGFRISSSVVRRLAVVDTACTELQKRLNREPTVDEVAYETGLPAWKILAAQNATAHLASLDDDSKGDLRELISDPVSPQPVDEALRIENAQVLESLLRTLDPRARVILEARFGLRGDRETLEGLGRRLHLTRERIRQIEFRALRHLRRRLERQDGGVYRLAA
jgi:RNA polymerase sigma factor (sigma-70 family)